MNEIRLQKWLSGLGIASRREAEKWIEKGRLSINGITAKLGDKVEPDKDEVSLDGKPIKHTPPPRVYWLLNKPEKFLTARVRQYGKKTIYDLHSLKELDFLVSPVGRLDYMTQGLLLLSNDGEFVHRLTHPKYKMPRHYSVFVDGKLSKDHESLIRKGVELDDGKVGPCDLIYAHGKKYKSSEGRGSWYFITVHEGRNRLVRRLFEHFGHKVFKLIRTGFGDLRLPETLEQGKYVQLTSEQISMLKNQVGLNSRV